MPEYDQLRAASKMLEDLRGELVRKIDANEGDQRTLSDLHQRVSAALRALSGLS